MSPSTRRCRRYWMSAVAAGGRLPSLWPSAIGGDALVSSATGLARETLRKGRREITQGGTPTGRIRRPGAGRPRLEQRQPGLLAALEGLVDPLTRGDPTSPLRWTCKSRAKLASGLAQQGWRVSSTTVGRLLHQLGYRLQSARKRQEGTSHPDRPGNTAGRPPTVGHRETLSVGSRPLPQTTRRSAARRRDEPAWSPNSSRPG